MTQSKKYLRSKRKQTIDQFSKMLVWRTVHFSMAIVTLAILADVVLAALQLPMISEETVTTITTFGGVSVGISTTAYAALCGWRDHSKNKHKIKENENGQVSESDNNG